MSKLICSAGSKEDLQDMINEYFYSKNYIITDDNKVYNKKLKKVLDDKIIVYKKNRWRFERR